MAVENGQPVVEISKLSKHFGDFVALDELTMELEAGQILGYIGPNGAGKTTTIKILVGLSRPTSGQAFIDGCDCTYDTKQLKQLVGYMPDVFGAYDNMRVREYLDFFGAAFKIPRRARQERIEAVMDITGSAYMRDLFVESLSHGMRQRVALARTLLHDPKVLILDEPANGLDPQARIDMRQILLRLADSGKTLIVTSHILPELARICDVVAIITHGKLRAFGTLPQIMKTISQRRVFQVVVAKESHVEKMTQVLERFLEEDAEVTPSPQESEVRFTTSADDVKVSMILAKAVENKVAVVQFHEVPLDLEDAFLEVTGGRREERADGKKAG